MVQAACLPGEAVTSSLTMIDFIESLGNKWFGGRNNSLIEGKEAKIEKHKNIL